MCTWRTREVQTIEKLHEAPIGDTVDVSSAIRNSFLELRSIVRVPDFVQF
jgi:hypothetical protein